MGSKSKTLHDLLLHQLRDLHYAERHGAKMLGKLAKAATSDAVKSALESAGQKAHAQVEQLDAVFEQLDKKSHTVPCEAMQGLIEEAKELLHEFEDSDALDAGLIAAARAMASYGIARCVSIRVWSLQLGLGGTATIIEGLLAEKRGNLDTLASLEQSGLAAATGDAADGGPLTLKMAALAGLA